MTETPNRQPAGTPTGGQFAPSAHAEAPAVRLHLPETAADIRLGFNRFTEAWDQTDEPDSFQMDDARDWAARVEGAASRAENAPADEVSAVSAAIDHWDGLDEHDLDAANDLVQTSSTLMHSLTAPAPPTPTETQFRAALLAAKPGERLTDEDGDTFTLGVNTGVRYYDGCPMCQQAKEADSAFFPMHKAMPHCRSGGRNHCTCGTCW
ncbi:hypothetical protein [Nocardioides pakistanensis]